MRAGGVGPRGLGRGSKPYERPCDPREVVGSKSHFIYERANGGWIITVRRRGQPPETIYCETEGELNRARRRLADDGLIGVTGGAR